MAQIDDYTKRGLNTPYTDTGAYNALDFAMSQKLQNELQTAYIGFNPRVRAGRDCGHDVPHLCLSEGAHQHFEFLAGLAQSGG